MGAICLIAALFAIQMAENGNRDWRHLSRYPMAVAHHASVKNKPFQKAILFCPCYLDPRIFNFVETLLMKQ